MISQAWLLTCTAIAALGISLLQAEPATLASDDASQPAYSGGWDNTKNGGNGFGAWTLTTEGNDENRHSGFFIADSQNNTEIKNIAKGDKAFGMFANGLGFEQAVAYRPLSKPLAVGDSFSFMFQNGTFERKFDNDVDTPGSIGLVLRSGNATGTTSDYNTGAIFEFGCYEGKPNYQIYDATDKNDSGVTYSSGGVLVTLTLTAAETYDLEVQTLSDKKVTKLPGRKLKAGGIESLAIFDRNGEKHDAFFNQLRITRLK